MTPSQAKALDLSAVGLSALCLIHCLALPLLALALPVLGLWAQAEWVHVLFVALAATMASVAFIDWKARRPRSWPALLIAAAGLMLMGLGAAAIPDARFERILTVAGGLVLASAHIANWRGHGHPPHG
ncbi:MerC domain-containing protein [Caulobacter segnis]